MTDIDQTVVLPRPDVAEADEEEARSPDPWEAPATGSAPVGGPGNAGAALTRLAWLLSTLVAAAVGLVRSSWSSLSGDELTTWALANTTWSQLWELRTDIDVLTAPYYALTRAWAEVAGSSEFSLRLPSVLAMAVAAGGVAALTSRLVSPRAGVLAGLLFAVLPVTSRYAHEAGPVALSVAFAVLSTAALVRFFERPRFWRWAGYTGAVALLGLPHAAALLLLLGHAGAVLILRRRVLPGWVLAAGLGAAPAAGLLLVGRPPWDLAPGREPVGVPTVPLAADTLFGLAVVGGLVVGVGMIGLSLRRPAGVFTAAALVPLLGLYPAAELTGIGLAELLLFTLPFWACLAATALARAPLVRGLVVVAVVGLVGLPVQLDLRTEAGHGLAAREVAAVLAGQVQTGDAIVYGPGVRDERVGRDLVARYVPAGARPEDVLALDPPRTGRRLLARECVDVAACVGDAPRVWLLRADQPTSPLDGLPAAKDGLLRVRYELVRTWPVRGASLSLFTLAPGELDRPAPR
ncbi:MAG: glycosyltransferase family 39 protein [Natronosporangium sp.]